MAGRVSLGAEPWESGDREGGVLGRVLAISSRVSGIRIFLGGSGGPAFQTRLNQMWIKALLIKIIIKMLTTMYQKATKYLVLARENNQLRLKPILSNIFLNP